METQRLALKLFAAAPCEATSKEYILFFHRTIQEGGLPETFIDVTDYSHVPNGPGVMLICHEAHYSMDHAAGRLGLKCATKRGAAGDSAARVRRVLQKTLSAAAAMESHEALSGKIRFSTDTLLFSIEDRLVAPSTAETFQVVAPVLAEVIGSVWGVPPVLARVGSPKECFQVEATMAGSPSVAEFVGRLGP